MAEDAQALFIGQLRVRPARETGTTMLNNPSLVDDE